MPIRLDSFIALLALTSAIGVGVSSAHAQQALPPLTKLITVNGSGTIREKPNIARVTLGVQTLALDQQKAASLNTDRIATLLKSIHDLGIEDKDIQTSGYSVSPQFRYTEGGNRTLTGYRVENNIRVTLRSIEKAGVVLDAGIKAGANIAGSVTFDLDDETATRDHDAALAKAVEDAHHKAVVIASTAKAGALELVSVVEGDDNVYGAIGPSDTGNNRVKTESAPTVIAPGEITITVTVTSAYNFDPHRVPTD